MNSCRYRIVHLIPALFDPDRGIIGGAERYAMELARHMAEVTPTRLVSFSRKSDRFQVGKLEVCVIGSPWLVRGQPNNPFSIRVFKEVAGAEVIHCHQTHLLTSSLSALFARVARKRVYTTDLGGGGWDISGYVSTDRLYHGHLHICRYSQELSGHDGLPGACVIFAGIDTAKFAPDPLCTRNGAAVIVGRILAHKGANDLIAGLDREQALEIIGKAYDPGYFQLLQQMATGKQVRFRTDCNDEDIIQAYRSAICSVLPSVYRNVYGQETRVAELLPLSLLEAMACGTPVIGTRIAGIPEIIVDGETGLLVPPNDPTALGKAVRYFRDNPHEVERMGRNARQRVLDKFTWPAVVARCLAAYGIAV